MCDYYVLFMDEVGGEVIDYGVVFLVKDIFWVGCQLWVFDVVYKDGIYYLYFLLKDKQDVFYIGVVISDKFGGLFIV